MGDTNDSNANAADDARLSRDDSMANCSENSGAVAGPDTPVKAGENASVEGCEQAKSGETAADVQRLPIKPFIYNRLLSMHPQGNPDLLAEFITLLVSNPQNTHEHIKEQLAEFLPTDEHTELCEWLLQACETQFSTYLLEDVPPLPAFRMRESQAFASEDFRVGTSLPLCSLSIEDVRATLIKSGIKEFREGTSVERYCCKGVRAEVLAYHTVGPPTVGKAAFVKYEIRVTDKETSHGWSVYKRYSEFSQLHQELLWVCNPQAAAQLPELPPKKMWRSLDNAYVQKKLTVLNIYLQQLLLIPPFNCTRELYLFLYGREDDPPSPRVE